MTSEEQIIGLQTAVQLLAVTSFLLAIGLIILSWKCWRMTGDLIRVIRFLTVAEKALAISKETDAEIEMPLKSFPGWKPSPDQPTIKLVETPQIVQLQLKSLYS